MTVLPYEKYQDRFDEIEELGNVAMGRFMLTEVFKKMDKTCQDCQRDRMRCTLRPLCPDRVFLNILIALGTRTSDLPTFCYQVHIRALESYLKSGAKRPHPNQPRYPLGYFRKQLPLKKGEAKTNFENFAAYLERITGSPVQCYAVEDNWFFSVGNGIFIVDLDRAVVSLDPDGDIIKRSALEPLLSFLAQIHDIKITILKDLRETWYLSVTFPSYSKDTFAEKVEPEIKELEKYWSFVRTRPLEKQTQILIGLDPAPRTVIRLQSLRETVQILARILKGAPKSKVKRTDKPEKNTPTEKAVTQTASG